MTHLQESERRAKLLQIITSGKSPVAKLEELNDLISSYAASQREEVTGETSDGYHTFNELYDFRKAYNANLFNEWHSQGKNDVHKSWKHSDDELCFGGGWFVVSATTPEGQITNHYEAKDWELFHCDEREKANEWDGHTAQDALQRLLRLASLTPQDQTQAHNTQNDTSELDAAIKDGLSNHTGEFMNPWLIKGSWTHEQLAEVLEAVLSSERLKKNLTALIAQREQAAELRGTLQTAVNLGKRIEIELAKKALSTSNIPKGARYMTDTEIIAREVMNITEQATKPEKEKV